MRKSATTLTAGLLLVLLIAALVDRRSAESASRASQAAPKRASTQSSPLIPEGQTGPTLSASSSGSRPKTAIANSVAPEPAATNLSVHTRPSLWPQKANPLTEKRFHDFQSWIGTWLATPPGTRDTLVPQGLALAQKRQDEMSDLIEADPRRALALAIPSDVVRDLPASIVGHLERHFVGQADLEVLCELRVDDAGHEEAALRRTLWLDDQPYQAYVYGARLDEPTQRKIQLRGITLDHLAAIEDSTPLPEPSPPPKAALALAADADAAATQDNSLRATSSPAASTWTEGVKRLILIRVDFPDLSGEPFSDSTATNVVRDLDDFYRKSSYGITRFALLGDGSDLTPVFRMPQAAAFYGTNDASRLRRDARAAATQAGYILSHFELDLVCMGSVPGFKWSGLAYVGAPGGWIRGTSSVGVLAHELGHNLGLNHANFWDTAGESIIGPGSSIEYGDKFDTMGSASAGQKHFNARYKQFLNWIKLSQVAIVTNSGTYRLFPHDFENVSGTLALRIARSATTNYWVEFRQIYTSNPWLMNGASLRWARSGSGNQSTLLLDTTPGSPADKDDAAILLGRTFSDRGAGIHITPLAKNGTQPESLDVAVQLGTFASNQPPELSLLADTIQTVPGSPVTFTASATDPDEDPVVFHWDFGDNTLGVTSPSVRHSWNGTGEFTVYCRASDTKGGIALRHLTIQVGSPSTYRISGRLVADTGPVSDARIYVSSTQVGYTDADGQFVLAGLPAGAYTLRSSHEDLAVSPIGFTNPIRVGPSQTNLTLYGTRLTDRLVDTLVSKGSIWQYLDDGSNQGTRWTASDFDDATWTEGASPLGYGDDAEKTGIRYGPNASQKYITTYFRRAFVVDSTENYSDVILSVRRDDGAIVYLNGQEVARQNMPSGAITSSTLASTTIGGADESRFFEQSIKSSTLRRGTNVIAVEIHQSSRSSSDMVFDLELVAVRVLAFSLPALSLDRQSEQIIITWPQNALPWLLEETGQLGPNQNWHPIEAGTDSQSGRYATPFNPLDAQRYYRLVLP